MFQIGLVTLVSCDAYLGLLVQGRLTADGRTPVGKFTTAQQVKLSSCTPAESAVTHVDNIKKSNLTLLWTAPPSGTGPVTFFYAVVVDYDPAESENTFYATLQTASIRELNGNAPLISSQKGVLWLMIVLSGLASRLF
eukprot:Em0008g593a